MHSFNLLSLSLLSLSLSTSAYRLQARQSAVSSGAASSTSSSAAATITSTVNGTDESNFIESVCYPTNSTGDSELSAPCAQFGVIAVTCAYGANNTSENATELAPADQQKCFCQGPFWQYLDGCMECERLHGAPLGGSESGWQPVQYLSAVSSSYCGAPTATQALDDFLSNWALASTIAIGTSTGGVNVLGTSTEVSLYFTLSSTGSTTASGTSAKSTGTTTGVAAGATAKDSATGSVTGSATGSVTAVSTTGSKSAATGLQVSGSLVVGLFAAALLL